MIYKVYYQETKDRNPKENKPIPCTLTQKARLLHAVQSNKTPHITSSLFKNLMKNILRMKRER